MHHWDRDTSGRLQRISTPVEEGYEISVHSDQMNPLPEEQQSQQGTPMNPTTYISMRDHIHPPRVSAPSCIIPPAEDVAVRPYLVPLLPTFHGMENENPYTHIRDFEEVCITFKEGAIDMDLLKLKVSRPRSRFDPIGESEPFSGCETIYWDSLIFFFFSKLNLYLWYTNNFCNNQQSFTFTKILPPEWYPLKFIHIY